MQVAYFYNAETKIYDHAKLVKDGDTAPTSGTNDAGEALGVTLTRPEDGLYEPRKYDVAKDVWTGDTKEHWLAAHPMPTPEPTAQDQAITMLAQNQTATAQAQSQMQQAITQIMVSMAKQSATTNTTK